jgi:hypothetical protein
MASGSHLTFLLTPRLRCVIIVLIRHQIVVGYGEQSPESDLRRSMSFLRRLFGGGEPYDPDAIWLYVKCDYCGQKMKIRVDRRFDLRTDYEQGGYKLDKEIMDGTCFSLMMARVRFDGGQKIISQELEGGIFLSREEYEQEESESAS